MKKFVLYLSCGFEILLYIALLYYIILYYIILY